jgi:hypothetical protein
MRRTLMTLLMALSAGTTLAAATVDCGRGQSLNGALRRLHMFRRLAPVTVFVKGTCSEYVQVRGFEELKLRGLAGATLVQPTDDPGSGVLSAVLMIDNSHGVTVEGLAVHSAGATAIGIRGGSSDVRLRDVSVEGGDVMVFEGSQASIAGIAVRNPRWAAVSAYDQSSVHLEDALFEDSSGGWHVGVHVAKAMVTMHGTVMRDLRQGIYVDAGGIVDLWDFTNYVPEGGPTEVVIESTAGTLDVGCRVSASVMNVNVPLRITNAGQSGSNETAGVLVENGGVLIAKQGLDVSGTQGQGVLVTGRSTATLGGAAITSSSHGGLVVVNQSSATLGSSITLSGNGTDLFCDSKSLVTGGSYVAGASTIQCANLQPGRYESLP